MKLTEEERASLKEIIRSFKTKEKSPLDEIIPVTQQEFNTIKREILKDGCERIK
ncbi:MAG: hypothetical protein ACOCQG_06360 [Candidatus Nanoarchaeia archaeon]